MPLVHRALVTLVSALLLLVTTAINGAAIDEVSDAASAAADVAGIEQQIEEVPPVPAVSDVVVRCGDCLEWRVTKGQQSKFAQQLPNNLSVTQCQRACVLNTDCVGFDYDKTSAPCWLHLATEDFQSVYSVTSGEVDQYRLSRNCKTLSDAGSVCEKIYEACVNGANYYKSACLEQASSANTNFNQFLENELADLCDGACRENEDCSKNCATVKSNGLTVTSQLYENVVATCNANFDQRKNDCNTNFLICL